MTFGREPHSAVAATAQIAALGDQQGHFFERPASGDGEQMTMKTQQMTPEPLPARDGSLTVDQMADALGLYACDFWAKHPRDCDVCSNAKEGEMIWVMMAGAYPGSTQEAEYYACSECVAIKHAAAFSSENT